MAGTDGLQIWSARFAFALALVSGTLFSVLAVGTVLAQSNQLTVADVQIVGNSRTTTERIMREIHTRPGTQYSQARVHEDISRLAATHLFRDIRFQDQLTADGRVRVIFRVQEHANTVQEVVFKHAKHISDKELETMTRIRKGMPLDKTLNQLACYEIRDHLQKKGRFFANVTLEEGFDDSHSRVVFNITEGPVVQVASIDFTGNEKLASAARLRTQIDSSKAMLLTVGGVFQPMMVESDVMKLEEYYKSNGFLNARVGREVRFSDDFRYAYITYHVREGERYKIGNVQVTGSRAFQDSELQQVLRVQAGNTYQEQVVSADVRNLTDYLGWRGFKGAVQKNLTTDPNQPGVVNVQYQIDELAPAKVSRVLIVGNTVTKDRVIRRVIGLYPGQELRYPELRIAEANLAKLNLFEMNPELGIRPTVTVLDENSPSPFKDVLVQVKETHTGSFMVGAGINSDNGLVGSIVLNERNFSIWRLPTSFQDFVDGRAFRGDGQELRIEAVPGNQLQRYSVTFREPFLFDRPYSFTGSGYYYDRIYDEYTERRIGGRFTVGHQFSREWGGSVGVRIEDVNVRALAFGPPQEFIDGLGHHFLFAPRAGITYDTRDSYLRPTEGGSVELSYEHVFGDYNFPVFNAEASRFFTTYQREDGSGKQVVALRSQFGYAGDDAPFFERFYGGGFRSIRGFQFRGVGPVDNFFAVGGQFMFMNSIEYQIPIMANDNLYFVTFLDTGTVERKLEFKDYRVSAGFGFRIAVPALGPVPLAFDFGFPIVSSGNDREQIFNFWVGMFR